MKVTIARIDELRSDVPLVDRHHVRMLIAGPNSSRCVSSDSIRNVAEDA